MPSRLTRARAAAHRNSCASCRARSRGWLNSFRRVLRHRAHCRRRDSCCYRRPDTQTLTYIAFRPPSGNFKLVNKPSATRLNRLADALLAWKGLKYRRDCDRFAGLCPALFGLFQPSLATCKSLSAYESGYNRGLTWLRAGCKTAE